MDWGSGLDVELKRLEGGLAGVGDAWDVIMRCSPSAPPHYPEHP